MSPIPNGRLIFNERPTGFPVPGQTTVYDNTQTIDPDTVPLDGGILIKTLVFSIDPSIRGKMRTYPIGEPVVNFGLGVVVRSENTLYKAGDHVAGLLNFEEYTIKNDTKSETTGLGLEIVENKEGIPWSTFVGIAGMPGKTAYYGWKEYATNAKKGDVLYVSTGAGPVGSLVIQLAKLDGLKVIASAGSDEKVKFMKEVGADVAFKYKTTEISEVLEKEGPINLYWDHVGGETLDKALAAAAPRAVFIECGMISGYNSGYNEPVRNLFHVIGKMITIHGLYIFSLEEKHGEAFKAEIPRKVKSGEFKYLEDVTRGLENAGQAILAQQQGKNTGKSVVVVADE